MTKKESSILSVLSTQLEAQAVQINLLVSQVAELTEKLAALKTEGVKAAPVSAIRGNLKGTPWRSNSEAARAYCAATGARSVSPAELAEWVREQRGRNPSLVAAALGFDADDEATSSAA